MDKIALLCILITSILAASSRTGPSGVRELLMRSQDDANQLPRRMVVLDVDPYELILSDPALVRHLQRQCAQCESRERCVRDLAHDYRDAAWRDRRNWREYCPTALDMLIVLQSARRPHQKTPFHAWLMRANGEHVSNIDRIHLAYWRPLCKPNSNQIHLLN